jgi:hypothetical protein
MLPPKRFKSLFARQLMEQAFALLGIQPLGLQLVSGLTQVLKPHFEFRAKLFFELDSQTLSKCRTLSRS